MTSSTKLPLATHTALLSWLVRKNFIIFGVVDLLEAQRQHHELLPKHKTCHDNQQIPIQNGLLKVE